jgi:hypothetical protein
MYNYITRHRDPRVSQGESQLGLNIHVAVVGVRHQVVEALDYHEHVVYPNTKANKTQVRRLKIITITHHRKGSAACMVVYGKPNKEARLTEVRRPMKTLTIPLMET